MPLRHRQDAGHVVETEAELLRFSNDLVEGGGILWSFTLVNHDVAAHLFRIHVVSKATADGGGNANTNEIIWTETLAANTSTIRKGPWHAEPGGAIRGNTDAAAATNKTTVRLTASEEYLG